MMKINTSSATVLAVRSLITLFLLGSHQIHSTLVLDSSLYSPLWKPLGHEVQPNKIWREKCSKSYISVKHRHAKPLPMGVPTFTVEIKNVCPYGCKVSDIHVNCGLFGSAKKISAKIFKRLRYNDCLVNNGKILLPGETIYFEYGNTSPYLLTVSSVQCQ